MRNIVKKYKPQIYKTRRNFKAELRQEMFANKALAIAILNSHIAMSHREHIMKIWDLLKLNHPKASEDYWQNLFSELLSGDETVWRTLHVSGDNAKSIENRFFRLIPENLARGDAVAVSLRFLHK